MPKKRALPWGLKVGKEAEVPVSETPGAYAGGGTAGPGSLIFSMRKTPGAVAVKATDWINHWGTLP